MSNSTGSLSMFDFTWHRWVISPEKSLVNNTAIFPRRMGWNDRRDREFRVKKNCDIVGIFFFFCIDLDAVIIHLPTFSSFCFFWCARKSFDSISIYFIIIRQKV